MMPSPFHLALKRARAAVLSMLAAVAFAGAAMAGEFNTQDGVAIKGYDPVAYFTDGKPVRGSAEFTVLYKDATFRFASAAHKALFEGDPEKYAPQYGGFCAFGTAGGHKVDTDPAAFTVQDGKLYLNHSKDVQTRWKQDKPGYISKANQNWSEVEKQVDVFR